MNQLLKSVSYVFHPLIMPILGVIFYFYITPAYTPKEAIYAKLISLSILTIILPLLIYFLLKTIGKVETSNLNTTKERILPLGINCIIIYMVIQRVILPTEYKELYVFFLGILISNMVCLLLAFIKFKASIHLIGLTGLFAFLICLSSRFAINMNVLFAFMSVCTGALATSRLHLKAHNFKEIIVGMIIGILPQLLLGFLWFQKL